MKHRIGEKRGCIVVSLEGDIDLEGSPAARQILLDAVQQRQPVYVDLSGVSYIDSSGIASLVEALQRARQGGTGFALTSVSDAARRVLELARLDRVFTIHASLDDALSEAD